MRNFFSLPLAAAGSAAHTIFQEFHVNGVSAGHEESIRVVEYDGVDPYELGSVLGVLSWS